MIKVLAAGVLVALVVTLLPLCVPAQAPASQSSEETEYMPGEKEEEEVVGGLHMAKGKHGRKMWRTNYWVNSLTGDKARVFETYGIPSSRYREEVMGRVQETWTYLEQGLKLTFSDDRLIRTDRISRTQPPNAGW